ncbi:MAG: MgtC/SapB family protein [Bacteroidales bacterium]|nr:MgtC/SapB family protein [Bacteroidales bacterium]MBQ2194042.1 MgtC/SapB family protein [Bacteroidales bacterium]
MSDFFQNEIVQLAIRLLAAAGLGAVIGYEREFRGKGAGVRTHMLVCIGACLFMLISKYGFGDSARFDAARVAAGVVSGIGFLGGGLIIKSKSNVITGLTTAAGLWVTGAIGMGAGSGMVGMAGIATLLLLFCMEILNAWRFKLGDRVVTVVLAAKEQGVLPRVIKDLHKQVDKFFLTKKDDTYRAEIVLRVPKKEKQLDVLERLNAIEGVELESME